jgi:hypothetical protein
MRGSPTSLVRSRSKSALSTAKSSRSARLIEAHWPDNEGNERPDLKGGLFTAKGDPAGAERAYIASLDWARTQQAKSWELRTATSYARLMRDQGRAKEAYELLAPVYGWFTEGFATKDLRDAKALFDELSADQRTTSAPAGSRNAVYDSA